MVSFDLSRPLIEVFYYHTFEDHWAKLGSSADAGNLENNFSKGSFLGNLEGQRYSNFLPRCWVDPSRTCWIPLVILFIILSRLRCHKETKTLEHASTQFRSARSPHPSASQWDAAAVRDSPSTNPTSISRIHLRDRILRRLIQDL